VQEGGKRKARREFGRGNLVNKIDFTEEEKQAKNLFA